MLLNLGLLVLRVVVGLTVAGHGAQKVFGWFGGPGISGFKGWLSAMNVWPAGPWGVAAALAEFAGGLFVAAGLLTPIAALAVCGSMLTAIILVHLTKGFWTKDGGYEFPLTILASMICLSLAGPGLISLDQALKVALPEPTTWLAMAALVLLGVAFAVGSTRVHPAPQTKPQLG